MRSDRPPPCLICHKVYPSSVMLCKSRVCGTLWGQCGLHLLSYAICPGESVSIHMYVYVEPCMWIHYMGPYADIYIYVICIWSNFASLFGHFGLI